ncbi:unnamed protein product [Caenorhabditis nigoni]
MTIYCCSLRTAPNQQPMSEAQQEPRIKTEPVDNDIYIVEAPTVPAVAKLAHGVANRTDVSALEEAFISKDNIKCLITEFLLPQCELRTK